MKKVELALNEICPLETKKCKRIYGRKPWLTKGLINACKKKNQMYRRFLETKLESDECKYKIYKNKLTKILKNAEKSHFNGLIKMYKHNIKDTWKVLNSVIRGVANPSKIPETFMENNIEVRDKKDIADGFNNFFINVGPLLAEQIQKPPNIEVEDYMPVPNQNTMFLDPVTEVEINNVVKTFGNKTSEDCHGISMSVIKQLVNYLAEPMAHISNLSFQTGVFPDLMKVAKVIPLFKSGRNNIFTNYRPVSLLPQFSKILEKLFNNRLDRFLNKTSILSNTQYGFRSNRSTSLALLELLEDITQ